MTVHLPAAPVGYARPEILSTESIDCIDALPGGSIPEDGRDRFYQFMRLSWINKTPKASVEQCFA
jgi:hypothetical protein